MIRKAIVYVVSTAVITALAVPGSLCCLRLPGRAKSATFDNLVAELG
jgi:hypothetical protein